MCGWHKGEGMKIGSLNTSTNLLVLDVIDRYSLDFKVQDGLSLTCCTVYVISRLVDWKSKLQLEKIGTCRQLHL